MQGNYKLFRQGGGRGAFAHVFVKIVHWESHSHQIVVCIDPNDSSSIQPDQEPVWFAAVIKGCSVGLQALEAADSVKDSYQVQVMCVRVNLVDTRSDALTAAAFLATVSAFQEQDRFQLIFQNGWHVVPT